MIFFLFLRCYIILLGGVFDSIQFGMEQDADSDAVRLNFLLGQGMIEVYYV